VGISLQSIWIIDPSFQNWLHARDSLRAQACCIFAAYHACQDSINLLENLLTSPKRSRGVRRCGFPECVNISAPAAMWRNISSGGFDPGFVVIADIF
jgi:hypothetical protein